VRLLVISDIHANIDALDAVLEAAPPSDWDRVLVLGDLVGYGAEPNAVIDRVRALDPLAIIRGNHDKASCGLDDGSSFNQIARFAATWTAEALTDDNRDYLRRLPAGPVIVNDLVEICHGAPFDEDYYLFDADDAAHALSATTRPLCWFGHTHLPVVFSSVEGLLSGFAPGETDEERVELADAKYLVNPGSVGQPRDGDPRAAFAICDLAQRSLVLRRAAYPVGVAQRRILSAGLPSSLANRLAIGR
jgi:predicted phosphodiesterase